MSEIEHNHTNEQLKRWANTFANTPTTRKAEKVYQQMQRKIISQQKIIENQKSALKEFHYTCYTQTCTMNHMENTDYEKGYMAGIRFGRDMADRYLGGDSNG